MACECGFYSSCVGLSRGCCPARIEFLKELDRLEQWLGTRGDERLQKDFVKDVSEDTEGVYR